MICNCNFKKENNFIHNNFIWSFLKSADLKATIISYVRVPVYVRFFLVNVGTNLLNYYGWGRKNYKFKIKSWKFFHKSKIVCRAEEQIISYAVETQQRTEKPKQRADGEIFFCKFLNKGTINCSWKVLSLHAAELPARPDRHKGRQVVCNARLQGFLQFFVQLLPFFLALVMIILRILQIF